MAPAAERAVRPSAGGGALGFASLPRGAMPAIRSSSSPSKSGGRVISLKLALHVVDLRFAHQVVDVALEFARQRPRLCPSIGRACETRAANPSGRSRRARRSPMTRSSLQPISNMNVRALVLHAVLVFRGVFWPCSSGFSSSARPFAEALDAARHVAHQLRDLAATAEQDQNNQRRQPASAKSTCCPCLNPSLAASHPPSDASPQPFKLDCPKWGAAAQSRR